MPERRHAQNTGSSRPKHRHCMELTASKFSVYFCSVSRTCGTVASSISIMSVSAWLLFKPRRRHCSHRTASFGPSASCTATHCDTLARGADSCTGLIAFDAVTHRGMQRNGGNGKGGF